MMDLLAEFWRWLAISKEEYITVTENQQRNDIVDFEEYMFPLWNELLNEVRKEIVEEKTERGHIDRVLTVMALDNENEDILDYIVENASNEYVEKFVEQGLFCPFFHARWQIAEILGRRQPYGWKDSIDILINDTNLYVSKRARNVLSNLRTEENWK